MSDTMLHRCRTRTVQSYLPDYANVHSIYRMLFWTHPQVHILKASRLVHHFCTAHGKESLYFTMGHSFSPSKLPLGIWTSIQYMAPSAYLIPLAKQHLDRFRHFCGVMIVTHRPWYSVCSNRPHRVLQCSLINNNFLNWWLDVCRSTLAYSLYTIRKICAHNCKKNLCTISNICQPLYWSK